LRLIPKNWREFQHCMKRYSEVMHEFAKARRQPVKAPQQVLDELKRIREQLAKQQPKKP
jgi:polyhydroxyalkanoate synthesis regulator protein